MTRSVTIVNTSNWDNEDYIITRKRTMDSDPETTTLKPGESLTISPGDKEVFGIEKSVPEGKEPKPFSAPKVVGQRTKTVQLIPKVKVEFEGVD